MMLPCHSISVTSYIQSTFHLRIHHPNDGNYKDDDDEEEDDEDENDDAKHRFFFVNLGWLVGQLVDKSVGQSVSRSIGRSLFSLPSCPSPCPPIERPKGIETTGMTAKTTMTTRTT